MAFTDPFIRRPVLATVVSLLIILLGLQAFNKLTIRQYPQLENALITVTTAYPGANAETIQGYITQPLQQSLFSLHTLNREESLPSPGLSHNVGDRLLARRVVDPSPTAGDSRVKLSPITRSDPLAPYFQLGFYALQLYLSCSPHGLLGGRADRPSVSSEGPAVFALRTLRETNTLPKDLLTRLSR